MSDPIRVQTQDARGIHKVKGDGTKEENAIQPYYYNPEVKFLLASEAPEKQAVQYNADAQPLRLPTIGPRPPYYCNPKYEPYVPVL